VCGQLKGNSVAVWEKGDFVLAVQEIVGVDIPRIAASVFLGLCLSVVLCVVFVNLMEYIPWCRAQLRKILTFQLNVTYKMASPNELLCQTLTENNKLCHGIRVINEELLCECDNELPSGSFKYEKLEEPEKDLAELLNMLHVVKRQ